MNMRRVAGLVGTALVGGLACLAVPAQASGDYGCTPAWTLENGAQSCWGTAAIAPGNDTRINLFYLLGSDGLAPPRAPVHPAIDWYEGTYGASFFDWDVFQRAWWAIRPPDYDPDAPDPGNDYSGSRCVSLAAGTDGFTAALGAAGIGAEDRSALLAARGALAETCAQVDYDTPTAAFPAAFGTGVTREFYDYLKAANAFYAGQWADARTGFAALAAAKDPWVRETAAYMAGRTELNAAQAGAFDEWGDFAGAEKTDKGALARAQAAFAAYLVAYPDGRYAASARGLGRRVLWLGGDQAPLAAAYASLLRLPGLDGDAAVALFNEVDNKLLLDVEDPAALQDPVMLAAWDLLQMRGERYDDAGNLIPFPAATLTAQAPRFAGHDQLFAFLQANHAYYIAKDYQRVLDLVPDAAHQPGYTPLEFSRQVLRGMALAQRKDRNEAGFWLDLIKGAEPVYQRPLVELALALNYERSGLLERVFAPDSPITDTTVRQILLEKVATQAQLRGTVKDMARPEPERRLALRTLLLKDLTHGRFADYAADQALLPTVGGAGAGAEAEEEEAYNAPTVAPFRKGTWSDGYACPAIGETARALADDPAAVRAQLCLGDFLRLNGFDDFQGTYWLDPAEGGLGSGPDRFGGTARPRAAIYPAVLANARASADDKAYALYRAVMCYAPSGNNSCGGTEVPKSRRQAWYNQLKQQYPASKWAKALRYYW